MYVVKALGTHNKKSMLNSLSTNTDIVCFIVLLVSGVAIPFGQISHGAMACSWALDPIWVVVHFHASLLFAWRGRSFDKYW